MFDTITKWSELPCYKDGTIASLLEKDKMLRGIHGLKVLPAQRNLFRAFSLTPYSEAKVLILGQDPYPAPGVGNGLAFSVNDGMPIPASLKNIYVELESDLGVPAPTTGNLTPWAQQGVLLLNTSLTVFSGKPASLKTFGWQRLAEEVVKAMVAKNAVIVLWGKYAQEFAKFIPAESQGRIIMSPHPSPFSARTGFFGSKPFSKINKLLDRPIQWAL